MEFRNYFKLLVALAGLRCFSRICGGEALRKKGSAGNEARNLRSRGPNRSRSLALLAIFAAVN